MSETVPSATTRWITLSGGVGGAKFAAGMNMLAASGEHDILINTADDFNHLGLRICPDVDSVTYALAGLNDRNRGWGRSEESWITSISNSSIKPRRKPLSDYEKNFDISWGHVQTHSDVRI
jgi:2-phospho-L-lactate transferase/gluconeogenesis factor (CofD/UPF0052 family)